MSFENAPFSKGLAAGLALSSIAVGLFDVKHYFHLQYWRFITHNLAFSSSGDLLLAELVLFNVGVVVERHFGTLKFASFVLISTILTALLELVVLVLCRNLGITHIPAGPSALFFSLLYQYSRIIPSVYDFRIFGVPLSNKSFTYILAVQLAFGRLPGSAATALIGIVAGQIYRSDIIPLKSYRIAPSISRLCKRFILPLVGATRPPRRSNLAFPQRRVSVNEAPQPDEVVTTARSVPSSTTPRLRAAARSTTGSGASVVREWVQGLTGRGDGTSPGLRVPTEAEITQLTTMFPDIPREAVIGALQRSANAESAVETLLSSQR
ncbi:uba domain-containing protein ucp14 [Moniliophthora roreri]|uniref:CUE domain-containing protein n=1 Tax=Moniliophthora roreri TaxID=221103 RepID=A0A0W0FM30_MONRR|nr:uba domain-containing protein ucp14 [Moniliophthora roreri]